jgi:hypothetical protein
MPRLAQRSMIALAACLALFAAQPAAAQFALPDTLYDAGSLRFDYAQTPFPFYSGTFAAEGEGLDQDGNLPPGADAAVGGAAIAFGDTVTTVIYGVTANPGGTYDGALIVLRTLGPLTPGNYPVDLENGTALFVFIDEAQDFSLPESPEYDDVMEWLDSLAPDVVLVSISGAINVTTSTAESLQGTFSGLTVDPENVLFLVNVTGGVFDLIGAEQTTSAPGSPLLSAPPLAAWPNPFNPRTTVVFSLPAAQTVEAAVFDLAGRRVRTLHQGPLGAGEQRLAWQGLDTAGKRAPAGVYLVRVVGDRWQESVKVVLAP